MSKPSQAQKSLLGGTSSCTCSHMLLGRPPMSAHKLPRLGPLWALPSRSRLSTDVGGRPSSSPAGGRLSRRKLFEGPKCESRPRRAGHRETSTGATPPGSWRRQTLADARAIPLGRGCPVSPDLGLARTGRGACPCTACPLADARAIPLGAGVGDLSPTRPGRLRHRWQTHLPS